MGRRKGSIDGWMIWRRGLVGWPVRVAPTHLMPPPKSKTPPPLQTSNRTAESSAPTRPAGASSTTCSRPPARRRAWPSRTPPPLGRPTPVVCSGDVYYIYMWVGGDVCIYFVLCGYGAADLRVWPGFRRSRPLETPPHPLQNPTPHTDPQLHPPKPPPHTTPSIPQPQPPLLPTTNQPQTHTTTPTGSATPGAAARLATAPDSCGSPMVIDVESFSEYRAYVDGNQVCVCV